MGRLCAKEEKVLRLDWDLGRSVRGSDSGLRSRRNARQQEVLHQCLEASRVKRLAANFLRG